MNFEKKLILANYLATDHIDKFDVSAQYNIDGDGAIKSITINIKEEDMTVCVFSKNKDGVTNLAGIPEGYDPMQMNNIVQALLGKIK